MVALLFIWFVLVFVHENKEEAMLSYLHVVVCDHIEESLRLLLPLHTIAVYRALFLIVWHQWLQ